MKQVLAVVGSWPSFQDAEVLSFSLARGTERGNVGAAVSLSLRLCRAGRTDDESDGWEIIDGTQVDIVFQFNTVEDVLFADFNHKNRIRGFSIDFLKELGRYRVVVEPGQGFGGSFICREAFVAEVQVSNNAA